MRKHKAPPPLTEPIRRSPARRAGEAALRTPLAVLFTTLALTWLPACAGPSSDDASPAVDKTSATLRAERRLYDGAPPVIPHIPMGAPCISCHNSAGMAVEGVGFAPPSPHGVELTAISKFAMCQQCHVFSVSDETFAENQFVGLKQDLRRGERLATGAPPVMPHPSFMRENCLACHSGPAAREEIRTSHPERAPCTTCHVETRSHSLSPFASTSSAGS